MSSGRYSSRGYLVQALIAVLDSFESPWDQIQVEPDTDNDKVDIAWYTEAGITVCQVKSSINNFTKKKIYGILVDVIADHPGANKYLLHLIGNGSDDLLKEMRAFSDISALPNNLVEFKNKIHVEFNPLNIDTLYNAIFSKVHQFLSRRDFVLGFDTIKLIAEGIVLKFVTLSATDEIFSKSDFEKILLEWVNEFYGGKKQNRQINIGFVNSEGNPTKDMCFKKIKHNSFDTLNELNSQIIQQIEEVQSICLTRNEIFDYSRRTIGSGSMYEQTKYGQISKDDYYSPFSPFALTSKPKDAEKIKNFTNDDVESIQDFGNLLFRMPSTSTGPKIIGTESELNKYTAYSKLMTLIDKHECIASYLHANDEYDVLSMFVTNDSRIAHSNIQLTISIRPALDFLRESKRFKTENQSTIDFLIEQSEDLLVLLREPLQINFSEYDNYGIFPIHISDKVISASRSFNGKLDFDLNYLKRYLTCVLSYEHMQLTQNTLVLKVNFKKLRAGEKMLFPSYLLIRANDDIVIDVEIISDELDKMITMHYA